MDLASIHLEERHFIQVGPLPPFQARDCFEDALARFFERLESYDLTDVKFHGLFSGPTGIVYFLIVLWKAFADNERYKRYEYQLQNWTKRLLLDIPRPPRIPSPSRAGIADEQVAFLTVLAIYENDSEKAGAACQIAAAAVSTELCDSNEWLYGRAGYLYLLRLLRSHFSSQSKVVSSIDSATNALVSTIMSSPRPWIWHGMEGFGAVHGSAGIITQVYLSDESQRDVLHADMEVLLDAQLPNGNWPTAPGKHDRLVQVCHGAPGIVISLKKLQIRGFFHGNPKLAERANLAIKKGIECVEQRGLLTKFPSLCHGIAGNSLAFPPHHEALLTCMAYMREDFVEQGKGTVFTQGEDNVMSLWTGPAGRLWAWYIYLSEGPGKDLVGYTDA